MISHHHKCVFVHVPKCGGQSVERVFLQDLGLNWQERAPLLLRPSVPGETGPDRLAHLTARDYVEKKYLPADLYHAYFSFATVRDPFSRAVSLYHYTGLDRKLRFGDFVDKFIPEILEGSDEHRYLYGSHAEYLTDNQGCLLVQAIVKLERINEELPPVLERVGIGAPQIPHVNRYEPRRASFTLRSVRKWTWQRRRPVEWTRAAVKRILDMYASDFELLGYPDTPRDGGAER